MKIALPSTNFDLGGAAIVTRRLTEALRHAGHDARMIVARAGGAAPDDPSVCKVGRLRWGLPFLAERGELFLRGVRRKDLFKVSTGRFGCGIDGHPFVRDADAVIINWASQGFLSLEAFRNILSTGRPVIYVMHDLWPATALCHLPGECRGYADGTHCSNCPYLNGSRFGKKLPGETADIKRELFASENLRLVAVSGWQKEQAGQSDILAGKEISVIPHAFPVDRYIPGEKVSPEGKRLIVMAAASLDDPVKDLPAAVEALRIYAYENPVEAAMTEVAFVGSLRDSSILSPLDSVPGLTYRHLGTLSVDRLRDLYAKASVVLSSSKFETMGATLMEGMAAGAIPATFGEAGQKDIVTDAVNGFIAPVHTPASLSFAISLAMTTAREGLFSPAFLHDEIKRRFSPESIASRYIAMLQSI